MAFFDFFRKLSFFKGRDVDGMVEDDLNFAKWIEVHKAWRNRLVTFINGSSSEALDENVVRRDDRCDLGRWIHDHGERFYGDVPAFVQLKMQHAEFHASAGLVVSLLKRTGPKAAHKALHEDFDVKSLRVVSSLQNLEREVKA
jgi:hypothetical protein